MVFPSFTARYRLNVIYHVKLLTRGLVYLDASRGYSAIYCVVHPFESMGALRVAGKKIGEWNNFWCARRRCCWCFMRHTIYFIPVCHVASTHMIRLMCKLRIRGCKQFLAGGRTISESPPVLYARAPKRRSRVPGRITGINTGYLCVFWVVREYFAGNTLYCRYTKL